MSNGEPRCPIHHVPMRPSKYPGSFFCPVQMGIGAPGANDRGYCSQRVKLAGAAPQPSQQAIVQPGASQGPSSAEGLKDIAAALHEVALAIKELAAAKGGVPF